MKDLWCYISRCATALDHDFFRPSNFAQTKICNLDLTDFLCLRIFFNEDIFWLQVSMHNTTFLNVLYAFNKLVHAEADLSLLELISLDMIKELSSLDLLHNNIHILLSLIGLPHLDNILVTYQLDYLYLFSKKVLLLVRQLLLNNLLGSNYLTCLLILALKHS